MRLSILHFRRRVKAFTLIELLVAMSVLIAITFMVTNLVSNVSITTRMGSVATESDSVARVFFSRLGADLNNMLIRDDIHYGFKKYNTQNSRDDVIAFLANVESNSASARPLSLVVYDRFSIAGNPPDPVAVRRAVRSVVDTGGASSGGGGSEDASSGRPEWSAPIFLPSGTAKLDELANNIVAGISLADADFQSFGQEIIRLEFSYIEKLSDGTIATRADVPAEIENLRGIVVAIAVLDSATISTLSVANLGILTDALSDSEDSQPAGYATSDIVGLWYGDLASLTSGDLSRAVANIRLYQRVYFFQQ